VFFLRLRVKKYLEAYPAGGQARVLVDEGFKTERQSGYPRFERQFANGLVCFARSDAILPIQLADFAAFAPNRHQIVIPLESDDGAAH